jgi:hypothetical protein
MMLLLNLFNVFFVCNGFFQNDFFASESMPEIRNDKLESDAERLQHKKREGFEA